MKTLYLLHGYVGNENTYLSNTSILNYSTQYNIAIIRPVAQNSYYLNPINIDETFNKDGFETFITKKLIEFTRLSFTLSNNREDTFIGGMSMGGYGAIHCALIRPDIFSKVVGISPALIIDNLLSDNVDYTHGSEHFLKRTFGDFNNLKTNLINPRNQYKANESKKLKNPDFYITIGKDDFLLDGCKKYVKFLKDNKANLTFIETEGNHDNKFLNKMLEPSIRWLLT